jgi:hypothetical protein
MKLQLLTMEKEIRKLHLRYNQFTTEERVKEQAGAFHDALDNFNEETVRTACKWFSGEKFPTAADLKQKCWDLQKENKTQAAKVGNLWRCQHPRADYHCTIWPIDENQARLSERQFSQVFCYFHEHVKKAEMNPGGIEEIWLTRMYPEIVQ